MERSQIISIYDQDERKDVEYPGMRREATPSVVRHVNTSGKWEGAILYSRLSEVNAEEIILGQLSFFESIGQDLEWKVYDYDTPADLKVRLESHGFLIEEAEALMVLDLEEGPKILSQPVFHQVVRITETEKITDVISVNEQVWDEDHSWLGDYVGEALSNYPDQMSVYVVYIDGKPASTASIHFPRHSRFASLWGGATVSNFRKRGIYTALLAVRAQEAKARRVRFLSVDASSMSRPILEKFGFEFIAWSYPCKWKPKRN